MSGILDREIVIYSVVVACIIVILGLSYLVQKYRKKTKKEPKANTVQRIHSNEPQSLDESNLSIYDEIDETKLLENANINKLQNELSVNTDNTSYLYPMHSEDDNRSSSVSEKSVNNSYLSINGSDQNHTSEESDRNDDTTSYLHPYHTIDEDWKEKTHQYDITHVSNKVRGDSSDSSMQSLQDGYLNPYQSLKEGLTEKSHSYETPVTVHHCQLGSSISCVLVDEIKAKGNDDNPIMRDEQNKVAALSEAVISTHNKQEMADDISWNDDIKEISASEGNDIEITKKSIQINNDSANDPSSTHRENLLVSVVDIDNKYIGNNVDNCNLFDNVTAYTIDAIHRERSTNAHDYTDGKSQ